MPLQYLEHLPPAEGQEASVACLLHRPGERGERDAEAHHLVAVHDGCDQVQVGYLDIVVHQLVNLAVAELTESIQVFVGGVEQVEHLAAVAFVDKLFAGELMDTQPIALAHHLGNLGKLVGHYVGHLYLHLHPVVGFLESLHLLHVLGVVGIVIVDIHGGQLVEAFDQHPLTVGVNESQRAC